MVFYDEMGTHNETVDKGCQRVSLGHLLWMRKTGHLMAHARHYNSEHYSIQTSTTLDSLNVLTFPSHRKRLQTIPSLFMRNETFIQVVFRGSRKIFIHSTLEKYYSNVKKKNWTFLELATAYWFSWVVAMYLKDFSVKFILKKILQQTEYIRILIYRKQNILLVRVYIYIYILKFFTYKLTQ